MEDVQSLIGLPGEEADEVVLAGKEHQKGELCYGEPCCTDAKSSVVLPTRDVVVGEFECEDRGEVEKKEDDCTE